MAWLPRAEAEAVPVDLLDAARIRRGDPRIRRDTSVPLVFRAADVTLLTPFLAYPMHVQNWIRPKGSPDYRITNPYGGIDLVNPDQRHQGVDVGNLREGDPVRAPATCRVKGHRHTDGALGLYYDLGGGWILELWHLERVQLLGLDQWQSVKVGTQCGLTGASGNVNGAHTHIELKRNGVNVDPTPFLPLVEREALAIPGATAGSYRFIDVPPSHPFYGDIEWMAEQGLAAGSGGGRYDPDRPVTRGELAAFLHRYDRTG